MPLLDLTDLLSDPDVAGTEFSVLRSTRTVGANGRTVDTVGEVTTYGSVQPASGAQLLQIPEAERLGSFINVVTPYRLQALTPATAPDQIRWNGRVWRVTVVNDWSEFGQGFTSAVCQLVSMT